MSTEKREEYREEGKERREEREERKEAESKRVYTRTFGAPINRCQFNLFFGFFCLLF